MATVTIIGAGFMGSAMAWPLRDNGHQVNLVGTHLDTEIIQSSKQSGYHPRLMRQLPDGVRPFFVEQMQGALAATDFIISGVNSQGVRWLGRTAGPHLQPGQSILAVTKGLEAGAQGEVRILPDILYEELPVGIRDHVSLAAIGGPCIAGELAGRRPTWVVFGARRPEVAEFLASQLRTAYYHVNTTGDLLSLEVCAALKNAYALAVGFGLGWLDQNGGVDGSGARAHNLEAAIFASAVTEMDRFLSMVGADRSFASGLPGAGDLFVTCQGGRSTRAGRLFGAGNSQAGVRQQMPGVTLESVDLVQEIGGALPAIAAYYQARRDMFPLMRALFEVIVKEEPPQILFEAVNLVNRSSVR
jgi:glycerol-3-phosphate dehydrogenase (NAD(P)+)